MNRSSSLTQGILPTPLSTQASSSSEKAPPNTPVSFITSSSSLDSSLSLNATSYNSRNKPVTPPSIHSHNCTLLNGVTSSDSSDDDEYDSADETTGMSAIDDSIIPRASEKNIYNDDDIVKDETSGTYIFNPYNPDNCEITVHEIESILTRYGVHTKAFNPELYRRAFIHRSYVKRPQLLNEKDNIFIVEKPDNCMKLRTKSNERLEFVGDGVLECITKYYLYRRFPKENEGFMTEKKIAIVKNEAIGKLALEIGLHKWFIISKHAEEKKIRTSLKKLGCLFEAFIGALFLDFNKISVEDEEGWFKSVFVCGPGFQMAQIFVENVFEKHIDWINLIKTDDNYKNILQVMIQKEFKTTPDYIELGYSDEEGYKMGVFLCLGQPIYDASIPDAYKFDELIPRSFSTIRAIFERDGKVLILFGVSSHKIKKKAEQQVCSKVITMIRESAGNV